MEDERDTIRRLTDERTLLAARLDRAEEMRDALKADLAKARADAEAYRKECEHLRSIRREDYDGIEKLEERIEKLEERIDALLHALVLVTRDGRDGH